MKTLIPTKIIAPLLLLVLFSLSLSSMLTKSATYDETSHLPSGYLYLKTSDFSFHNHNPPLIKILAAVPLLAMDINLDKERYAKIKGLEDIGLEFMNNNAQDYRKIFFYGRLMILVIGLFGGFIVFAWARKIYGYPAGCAALFFYSLSPNILAHSHFVTSDLGSAVFILAALYFFSRWLKRGMSAGDTILSGVLLGCAELTKFSALPLYGILIIYFFYYYFKYALPRKSIVSLAAIFLISIIIINAGYLFDGTFTPIGTFEFKTQFLNSIQNILPSSVPMPLPYEYVSGFDVTKADAYQGYYQFFMGMRSVTSGWWYYYPVAFLLKVPIAFILALSLLVIVRCRERLSGFKDDEVLMLIMLSVYAVTFILAIKINIGLRYMLPLFPVLHILASRLVIVKINDKVRLLVLAAVLIFYGAATLNVHPHYLSFFNSFAGGPENGYNYLIDSNIDWGQDLPLLKKYMDDQEMDEIKLAYFGTADPGVYGIKFTPLKREDRGVRAAVSVNYYQGYPPRMLYNNKPLYGLPDYYSYLHDYPIVDRVGYSLLIFDIPPD